MQIMIGKKSTCLVYIYIHYVFKVCMHIYTYIHRKDRCICFNLFQNIFENPNVHSQRSWPNDTAVFQSQHVYWIPDGIGWLKAWFFWGDSWIMIVSKFWLESTRDFGVASAVFFRGWTGYKSKAWLIAGWWMFIPQNIGNKQVIWLVVYLPLWKIWKSVGAMRFPIYGKS